eukprot:m.341652 g.341652  ORF g.341652 m.341652 type:complete len:446 (+) comp20325_c0_seq1:375-1712(+)
MSGASKGKGKGNELKPELDPDKIGGIYEDTIVFMQDVIMQHRKPHDGFDIEVPCDNCKKSCPGLRCARCRYEMYCSAACQKTAWKSHKPNCKRMCEQKQNNIKMKPEDVLGPEYTDLQSALQHAKATKSTCAMCNTLMTCPLRLKSCKHMFCFTCISKQLCARHPVCIICSKPVGNAIQETYYLYAQCVARCQVIKDNHPKEFDALSRQLGKDLQELADATEGLAKESGTRMILLTCLVETYKSLQDWSLCFDILMEMVETLGSEKPIYRSAVLIPEKEKEEMYICSVIDAVTAHTCVKNFAYAQELQRLVAQLLVSDETKHALTIPHSSMLDFLVYSAEIYLNIGNHPMALKYGMAALRTNRHRKTTYVTLAETFFAMGEFDKAINMMRFALKYETPWDDANIKKLQLSLTRLIESSKVEMARKALGALAEHNKKKEKSFSWSD